MHSARAFGLRWDSDVELRGFSAAAPAEGSADVVIRRNMGPPPDRATLFAANRVVLFQDGFRYTDESGVAIDAWGAGRVEWTAKPGANGELPLGFFGTVTAFLLARRGMLPIHGSAVAMDDGAILVCGAAGAGKSTLCAGLVALGGRLVSDDLSALIFAGDKAGPSLPAGRPGIRLYPEIAGYLQQAGVDCRFAPSIDAKRIALPPRVDADSKLLLKAVVLLGDEQKSDARPLAPHLYRPVWMSRMPGAAMRDALIDWTGRSLPIVKLGRMPISSFETFIDLAKAARTAVGVAQMQYRRD